MPNRQLFQSRALGFTSCPGSRIAGFMKQSGWKERSKRLRIVLEIGLLGVLYWGMSTWQTANLLQSGMAAPAFALSTLEGEEFSLQNLRGKRVLLHFWATWCGVCRQEHDALNAIYDGLGPDEVLLAVVLDVDNLEPVRIAMREGKVRYPVLLGTDRIQKDYRVSAFPTNYYVDPAGKIAAATVGMTTRWGMNARLGCAR